MLACILLTTASLLGTALALRLPQRIGALSRLTLGVLFGQALLLWLPFGLSACFDLSAYRAGSASLAVCALALGALTLSRALRREARALWLHLVAVEARPQLLAVMCVTLPLVVLLALLSITHYLQPRSDGLHSAGVTWGDLPLHLALATRALYAPGSLRLEHPLFLGGPLAYPFLPDYSVAVLGALGLPLRWAFIVGGLVPLATLPALLFEVTQLWFEPSTGARKLGVLSVLLFFFAGGLGFVFVLEALAAGEGPGSVLARLNATYIDPWVLKSASIGNLFIAARSAAYGMPLGAAALLLLGHAAEERNDARGLWLVGGGIVGILPLIHGHSFVALCAVLLFYSWPLLRRRQLQVLAAFGMLSALAAPQLLWLAAQGAPGALRFAPGMLQPWSGFLGWLRDVVLDFGLWLVLVPIAFVVAPARARRLSLPLLALFPVASLVCLTPAQYDNVKLLAWFDLGAAPLVAALLAEVMVRAAQLPRWASSAARAGLRRAFVCLAALGCTLSAGLALLHELTNDALLISYPDLELAQLVREHTAPDAVIATAASYHDPVAMFSGRRVPLAAPAMLGTHGIFVRERALDVMRFFRGGPEALAIQKRLRISAALVSARERHDLPWLDEAFLRSHASHVLQHAAGRLYLLEPPRDQGTALR